MKLVYFDLEESLDYATILPNPSFTRTADIQRRKAVSLDRSFVKDLRSNYHLLNFASFFSLFPSIALSIAHYIDLIIALSFALIIALSIALNIALSIALNIALNIALSIALSISLSIALIIALNNAPSISLFLYYPQ